MYLRALGNSYNLNHTIIEGLIAPKSEWQFGVPKCFAAHTEQITSGFHTSPHFRAAELFLL